MGCFPQAILSPLISTRPIQLLTNGPGLLSQYCGCYPISAARRLDYCRRWPKSFFVHDEAIILLVEDQPNDYLLIRRAFDKGQILNPLFVVTSGEEAVAYLSGKGRFHN